MTTKVLAAPAGTLGFDCNAPLSRRTAELFAKAGYKFAIRYAPRVQKATHDLGPAEVQTILQAGMGIMVVQHVERDDERGWTPSAQKGIAYGKEAASHCIECGILPGTMCWLDLEGVADIPHQIIIDYCNNWWQEVGRRGFTPGIYVGWHARLSSDELYRRLKFEHYWAAYNLNKDQMPAVRGVQMKQGSGRPPAGVDFEIDTDVTSKDLKGGTPLVMAPEGWLE